MSLRDMYNFVNLKRKIGSWTGIRISDHQISRLMPYDLSYPSLSSKLEIWSSEVRIPVKVRIFLLKSKIVISQGTNYKFVSTYRFDLKQNYKEIMTK